MQMEFLRSIAEITTAKALFLTGAVLTAIMEAIDFYPDNNLASIGGWWNRMFGPLWWKQKFVDQEQGKGRRKLVIFGYETPFYVPVQVCDPWHFLKFLLICCYTLAVLMGKPSPNLLASVLFWGTAWNLTFTATTKLLKIKNMYLIFFLKTIFPNAAMTFVLLLIAGACFYLCPASDYQIALAIAGSVCITIAVVNFFWQRKHDLVTGSYKPNNAKASI